MGPNLGAACRKRTPEQVTAMRNDYRAGMMHSYICKTYGVHHGTLNAILFGRSYGWVPGAVTPSERRYRVRRYA
jgi:hypothetical protein